MISSGAPESAQIKQPLAVVAHDAGGANVIAALMTRHRDAFDWLPVAAGPAVSIFTAAGFERVTQVPPDDEEELVSVLATAKPKAVLTGTGWQTLLERKAIHVARKLKTPVASVLDHWVNYRQRFGFPGDWLQNLPDAVLVGDRYAYAQACDDGFPRGRLVPVENPYLAGFLGNALQDPIDVRRSTDSLRVLFVAEPLNIQFAGETNRVAGVSELTVAEEIAQVLSRLDLSASLVVRSHPSQPASRYAALLESKHPIQIKLHDAVDCPLKDDIAAADVVVGVSSMALLVAAALGRPVIAYAPHGLSCDLPHREIKHCASLDALALLLSQCEQMPSALDLQLYSDPFDRVMTSLVNATSNDLHFTGS
ncbi:MAG TPA: hypothetical protein VM532_11645 [Burkholderiales bacterium]|nr:hypothetical protein [Burkholderiales bacterium]